MFTEVKDFDSIFHGKPTGKIYDLVVAGKFNDLSDLTQLRISNDLASSICSVASASPGSMGAIM
jgi:hypothetical protein